MPVRSLREQLREPGLILCPLVLDPLSALLAQDAGFEAAYLGGGGLGYLKGFTEANLMLNDFVSLALDIRAVADLPLILDGAAGWGDPMHMRRTIPVAEASGFAAIELEDQVQPKRAHHHAGLEHVIDCELMEAKIAEARAARRDPDFVIIGRTNSLRTNGRDEAVRRLEAYHRAGADLLMAPFASAEDLQFLGARLPVGLVHLVPPGAGGIARLDLSPEEMMQAGVKLLIDPLTPLVALHNALAECYAAIRAHRQTPNVGMGGDRVLAEIHRLIKLDQLLSIEARTVERPGP